MKYSKKIIKVLKPVFFIGLLLMFAGYLYTINSWRYIATKDDVASLSNQIKNAEPLPERFYTLYDLAYSNTLDEGAGLNALKSVVENRTGCPSLYAARISTLQLSKVRDKRRAILSYHSLAMKLENSVSQKQCLNWIATTNPGLNNVLGAKNVSDFYFEKSLSELNDKELATLVVMLENWSLYNPLRNPEVVEKKVNELLSKI